MAGRWLRDRVAEAVRDRALWESGHRVAVAVSGGLDSVILLHALLATRGRHGAELSVVTIDHGTRPSGAEDADFVVSLASGQGLDVHRVSLGLGEGASEERCRVGRYTVFDGLDVDRVALAHHRDDQAETVLLRLLRGAGSRGLSGMAWRRGRYVRPLLSCPRTRIHAYASEHGLVWREDPTNTDPRFLRNRVRHEVLPLLGELREGAAATLARTATHAAQDDALLCSLARQQIPCSERSWLRADLVQAPPSLARRALLAELPGASASQIDAILAAARRGTGTVSLSGAILVRIEHLSVSIAHRD